jgi:hypothetical protein
MAIGNALVTKHVAMDAAQAQPTTFRENTTGSITYGHPLQKCEFQYV